MTGALARARRRRRAGRRVPAPRRRRQRRAAAALPRRHLPARGLRLRAAARGAPTSASTCPAPATSRSSEALARPRPGPADGRHLLLPLAPPDRQHRLRRRALRRDRGAPAATRSPVWSYTLRRDADGAVPALELLERPRRRADRRRCSPPAARARPTRSAPRAATASARPGRSGTPRALADARRAGDPGRLRDRVARGLGGLRLGPRPARRRHPGRDPRVRRAPARRRRSRSRSATRALAGRRRRVRATSPTPSAAPASRGWPCARRGCARCPPPSAASPCC